MPEDENSGVVFARRFGRGLLWLVVILAAVTGVRSWVAPSKGETPAAEPAQTKQAYPEQEAQAVAGRFARAYLGWDETQAEEREQLLASVLPAGADTAMGWDGHGRQSVLAVQPGAVTTGRGHQARVRVDALIKTEATEKAEKKATEEPARWIGLDVPVVETAGRIVVTGQPGLVGIPATGPEAPDLPAANTDQDLSTATEDTVDTFFSAYAGGDVDTVTAPGAKVPALPVGIQYEALTSWSADTGSGDDRTGTAHVTWALGGATVDQVYRVHLTRVSSPDAERWQVSDVLGGSL
ncbi:conjugal transfer protein [Streptomyces sp. NPDC090106]|uniref:conjugal transfer protein n=1 Tax=Streptomyces sp. NPDC090106 TaxID=3365946 RepID=UPI0038095B7D